MDDKYLKKMGMLSIWEMINEVDKIEKYAEKEGRCVCYQLDRFEEIMGRNQYIVIGAGKDGDALIRLLELMGKQVTAWCDNSEEKIGKHLSGHAIISVEEALNRYSGDIILIATRKYEIEILEQIKKSRPEAEKNIFDYHVIYARAMWAKEAGKQAVLSYPPMWMTIAVTSACPNRCLYCAYHGEAAKGVSNTYGLPYMLSYTDFCRMVDMAFDGGVPHIHICATGEPFINPDILKMIDYVIEKYGNVSLQTDFWKELYQKKNYLDEIIKREKHITYIATDILSGKEEEHNEIKKGMKYQDLMEMLEYLGKNSSVRIRVVNIITRKNYRNLKGIIDDLLVRNVNFELMITNLLSYDYSEFTSMDNVYQSVDDEITRELKEVKKYAEDRGVRINVPNPADCGRDCTVFWETFQTWPVKGCIKERYAENMIPHACAAVVRGQLNSVGYLFDYKDIMTAWNNERLVGIRKNIVEGIYPDEWCAKCFMGQKENHAINGAG